MDFIFCDFHLWTSLFDWQCELPTLAAGESLCQAGETKF
jgi:hypothetical protein